LPDTGGVTEPSPEPAVETPAPRRRRPILIALAVVAVVVLGLVAWAATQPPSETGDRDLALAGVLDYGGPEGWQLTREPSAQPRLDGVEADAQWVERDGDPVLLSSNGFSVMWVTAPATPEACRDLAGWAGRRMAPEAASDVLASCPAAVAGKPGDVAIVSSYGTEAGEHGRYLFSAWAGPLGDQTALFAGLTYDGPAS
jgi:hypothetical protein